MTVRTVLRGTAEIVLLIVILCGGLCGFLSPNPPRELNLRRAYAPPTKVHFFDVDGIFHLRPFVYQSRVVDLLAHDYDEEKGERFDLRFFSRGWEYQMFGFIPASIHLVQTSGSAGLYLLGTDDLGRDVLARLLAGTRTSLMVVAIGLSLYTLVGLSVGGVAGSAGGAIDGALMRFSEFVLALPALDVLLAMRSLLPVDEMSFLQTLMVSVGTIAVVTWPPMARGVRGQILQLKSAGYVEAARCLGGTPWQVFRKHMLPTLLPFVLTQSLLAAPVFILGEALLSYLGFGFQSEYESWGSLLAAVNRTSVMTDFWWNMTPLALVRVSAIVS